ncbi:hypothetical protein IWQ49_005836 [Labrenzia sp. EL_126]|nr:hypothetical protein [Labrenzia sp. EL_126]
MYCLAGDATGIVTAAMIVPVFHLTNRWGGVFEYIAGFICGLFIFQALMMRGMHALPGADTPALGHRSPEPAMSGHLHQVHEGMAQDQPHRKHDRSRMEMEKLALPTQIILIAISFAILIMAGLATSLFVPVRFGLTH